MNILLPNYFAETFKEYLEAWQGTQKELAETIGILPSHISEMKKGKRRCTPEYDLRISRLFGIKPGYFMALQTEHDMELAKEINGKKIASEIKPLV